MLTKDEQSIVDGVCEIGRFYRAAEAADLGLTIIGMAATHFRTQFPEQWGDFISTTNIRIQQTIERIEAQKYER